MSRSRAHLELELRAEVAGERSGFALDRAVELLERLDRDLELGAAALPRPESHCAAALEHHRRDPALRAVDAVVLFIASNEVPTRLPREQEGIERRQEPDGAGGAGSLKRPDVAGGQGALGLDLFELVL